MSQNLVVFIGRKIVCLEHVCVDMFPLTTNKFGTNESPLTEVGINDMSLDITEPCIYVYI